MGSFSVFVLNVSIVLKTNFPIVCFLLADSAQFEMDFRKQWVLWLMEGERNLQGDRNRLEQI